MKTNSKRRPFYRVLIGGFCAILAVGSLLSIIGRIFLPESFPQPILVSLLFFGFFLVGAIAFLEPVKDEIASKKESSKAKISFFRVGVFFAVWLVLEAVGVMSFSGSLGFSLFGIIVGLLAAYYIPIPKRWKSAFNSDEGGIVASAPKSNEKDSLVVESETIKEDGDNSDKESVIYEKEDIDL